MRISDWSSDVCSSDLVRIALLEADVALPVVRDFIENITEKAVGQNVLKSVTPGQQVVKIVNDGLTEMLGSETSELMIDVTPPAIVMMVGLQGSGKRSEEHTSELQSLMRNSYAVFCLKKKIAVNYEKH